MRRAVPISILTSCALVLAACGGDDGGTADTGTPTTAAAAPTSTPAGSTTGAPTSSTASVTKPSVQIPAVPLSELKVTDLIEGSGTPAAAGDLVLVNYVGVRSKDGVQFDNSYDKGTPFPVSLGAGRVIKGWDQGLVGAKAGGRRQLDIPASLAYGAASQGDVIGPNEDLSFVIDVLAVVKTGTAADEPKVVVQGGPPVTELTTSELVPGSGATAELGQTAIINYVFFRADTGAKLASSWGQQPPSIALEPTGQIDGIINSIVGMKVGGRRQSTIPAADVFGGAGNAQVGLDPGIDLVMVADLLAVY
jgi:FKBP-type peptidyl-prolyl cis-trans isomerase